MAKFAINASGAMLLLNLIQVTESISGSVVPLAMFLHTVFLTTDITRACGAKKSLMNELTHYSVFMSLCCYEQFNTKVAKLVLSNT